MNIEVTLSDVNNAYVIKNMYPLYLHDLSAFHGYLPNKHGILEDEEQFKTLSDQYDVQDRWWKEPAHLFPYLISVNSLPAGFAFVSASPYTSPGYDYSVYEFFLLSPFRGKSVGQYAAFQLFDTHPGRWELHTHPSEQNSKAQCFWRKTISKYTAGIFIEESIVTEIGVRLFFRFVSQNID